ncbi:MAG TPA: class I SAM-dependent methyltransferase [Ignavibacteriaceae bacterium]|nr:class I SAM-dependent methyltransferase [Ignavibacteriaceae bacterium]
MSISKEKIDLELEEIRSRYKRRNNIDYYSFLNPAIYLGEQEKELILIKLIKYAGLHPLENKKLLEIGAGTGKNILEFIRLGFLPENLTANELLPERFSLLRKNLPTNVTILEGNALELNLERGLFDIVFQSMVFSSILDKEFQKELAEKMWSWTKSGGGILWYDFTYNNPRNKDVAGMSFQTIEKLFPQGKIKKWRLTLAPPLSRAVTKITPQFYYFLDFFPFLRTHLLCWIQKPKY